MSIFDPVSVLKRKLGPGSVTELGHPKNGDPGPRISILLYAPGDIPGGGVTGGGCFSPGFDEVLAESPGLGQLLAADLGQIWVQFGGLGDPRDPGIVMVQGSPLAIFRCREGPIGFWRLDPGLSQLNVKVGR